MILEYEFPLRAEAQWCPDRSPKGSVDDQAVTPFPCQYAGMRGVRAELALDTPAGHFARCFQLGDQYNGGGMQQTFCEGLGVVERKYDHAGSRFGFSQVLSGRK